MIFNKCIGKLAWEIDFTITWPRNYAALLEYYKVYGTCNVPYHAKYECDLEGLGEYGTVYRYVGNLGLWLAHQRTSKKRNKITPERQALLQKLVDEGKHVCVSFHILAYHRSDHLLFHCC